MFTPNRAHASFEEGITGSPTAGKLADLIVLNQDPWQVPPEDRPTVQIDPTLLDGRLVDER